MDLERYLKRYLEMGWSVIPMAPGSKVPTRGISWSHYVSKGVTEEDWERWRLLDLLPSGHGLALICGKTSGVVVIDADDAEAAAQVRAELFCPEVITARGAHFYLCYDPRLRNGPLEVPGIGRIEIKSDGSLTTLPPSRHPSGHCYSWALEPWEIELPKVPDWLIEAQRERERREKLKGQIVVVGFPKKDSKRRLTPEILKELLERAGVRIKGQRTFNGREFWPLRTCPVCGQSEGNPWIWPDSGRLVCFRATCKASKFNGGLPLRAWLAKLGLQNLLNELEPPEDLEEQEAPPPVSLDEARARIAEALRAKGDIFLAVPPGVGKSTIALRWACQEAPQPVVYSTPTHALTEELAAKARELGTLAQVIKGRSPETCLKFWDVETCRRRGFDPGQVLCPFCEHHLENPQMAEKCLFWRQFEAIKRDEGLYFCSHLLATYLLNHELRKATTWIVDEQPLQLLQEVEFSAEGLRSLRAIFPETSSVMKLIEEVLKLADALHKEVATTKGRVQGRLYPKPPQVGPWKNRVGLFELLEVDPLIEGPKIFEEIQETLKIYKPRKLFDLGVNFHAINWIRELFTSGACHITITKDPKKPIVCRYSVNLVPSGWTKRLVILDATGDVNVLRKLFRRPLIEEVNVYVPVEGRKIFVRDRITKSSLQKGKIKSEDLKKALEVALREFPAGTRVVLFAHQVALKRVQAVVKSLRPDLEVVFTYHFGSKTHGVNTFRDFDGVVVFGLPLKNPEQFYQTAQALGLSQEEFQNWVAVESKAELLQELHRIRPVLKPGKTLVVVGRSWPLGQNLGSPDEVIDLTPLGKKTSTAVSILLAWLEVFGFVLIEIALLLGIGLREQIPHEKQRTQVLVKVGEKFPTKLAEFFKKIEGFSLIRLGNPFNRQEGRQRKDWEEESSFDKGVPAPYKIYKIREPLEFQLVEPPQNFPELPSKHFKGFLPFIRLNNLEFGDRKWWPKLFYRLHEARPDLPVFEFKIPTSGGLQWSRGLGNIKAAQAFYQALGREIDPNAWREVG